MTFSQTYPVIARWIAEDGLVEIGTNQYTSSMARAFDNDGIVWESRLEHKTVDEALAAMEKALQALFEENK
jgi:hypothetical protein